MTALLFVSVLVKVTVILVVALGAARLARKSRASARHSLLAAAFVALLVCPVISWMAPSIQIAMPVNAVAANSVQLRDAIDRPMAMDRSAEAASPLQNQSTRPEAPSLATVALGAWVVGLALFLVPVVVGLWQMRALRHAGTPWTAGQTIADELSSGAGIRRLVRVLMHPSLPGPVTCGLVRPVIVLPADSTTWLEADVHRAIVHELEHIRRADWMTQCLTRVVAAVYWMHPLVWIARRQLILEAERACDDAVLRRTEATAYADQLVVLAQRWSRTTKGPLLAMAHRSDLARRVDAVLDDRQSRGRAGARALAVVSVVTAVAVIAMSPLEIVAQTPSSSAASNVNRANVPKFEVASIKPCKPVDTLGKRSNFPNGGLSPGRMHVECLPLVGANGLIRRAYGTFADGQSHAFLHVSALPVEGGPDWLRSEYYTIDAKADGTPELEMMHGPMLQALLEDRFHLKVHRETRDVPVYELTVARGGPKLKPFDGKCKPIDYAKGNIPAQLEAEGSCPIALRGTSVDGPGQTISDFMTFVLVLLDRPVVDKTGLTGRYDIYLTLPPDETPGAGDVTTTLAGVLQQQLGLRLVPAKGHGEVIVIDHAERPRPD